MGSFIIKFDKAYGTNNAILDNCHVRVAFAPNDERTAKRLSDALGTTTELRSQRNLAGHRLSPWLSHLAVAEQETPRPLMTPGEVLQLPPRVVPRRVRCDAAGRRAMVQVWHQQELRRRTYVVPLDARPARLGAAVVDVAIKGRRGRRSRPTASP